jgi:hypothetical protein
VDNFSDRERLLLSNLRGLMSKHLPASSIVSFIVIFIILGLAFFDETVTLEEPVLMCQFKCGGSCHPFSVGAIIFGNKESAS